MKTTSHFSSPAALLIAALIACLPLTSEGQNDAPTVASDTASVTVDEGSTALASGTFSDSNGDAVTITASVGTITQSNPGTWTHQQTVTQGGNPIELVLDSQENLYVVNETQKKVYRYDSSGDPVTNWTVTGSPTGVAVDSTNGWLYVSLKDGHRVDKYTLDGTFLLSWGTLGTANGQFNAPHCVALDAAGNVYVTDSGNRRVQVFNSSGTFLRKWGTLGSSSGQFNFPQGIRITPGGTVYVADRNNNRVQYFDTNGTFLGSWGTTGSGDGQFNGPASIGIDPGGNVVVGDISNNRIQKFTATGVYLDKLGPATSVGNLALPHGTAFPPSGRSVYIADWGNGRVVKFATPGGWSWSYPTTDGPDQSQYVTITATDNGSPNLSSSDIFTLTVNNVAPTIVLTGAGSVDPQTSYTLNLGPVSDPGADTVTGYTINWGDGTPAETFTGDPAGQSQTHTYAATGSRTISVALTDEDGTHPNAGTKTISVVDTTPPSVTINQAGTQADPTNVSPINFTVVFSEPVTNFTTGDVTLSGTAGATTAAVTGSGSTYNVAVSGMTQDGTVIATIAAGVANDAAGNGNNASTSTDNSVTFDNTPPSVTINQAAGQTDPTVFSPINFTVVFSESVTDFDGNDVTLTGTAGPTTATVTGSGTTYNVAVSGMTATGTVTASIAAGRAHDAAGNGNTASTSTDNTVFYVNTNGQTSFEVNSLADTDDGVCAPAGVGNGCTLREAINAANTAPGPQTITFSVMGTINLTSPLPNLSTEMTIDGPGAGQLTVRRDTGGDYRIFNVTTGATVTINELTIANGRMLNPNNAITSNGGGIFNGGTLTLQMCVVSGNTAAGSLNTPAGSQNFIQGLGGGVYLAAGSTLNVTASTFAGNRGDQGGAIYNQGGTLTLDGSVVVNNASTYNAGGIYTRGNAGTAGSATITKSTISGNSGGNNTQGFGGAGGGLFNLSDGPATLTVTNSTVSGNTAPEGGGVNNTSGATLNLRNSTVSGNTSSGNNSAGGVVNNGTANITSSTITNNTATGSGSASGVISAGGTATVGNTLIAANVNNATIPDVSGTSFVSQGYNFIGNRGTVTTFNQTGDQTGTAAPPLDPKLAPLGNNGGQTQTHALLLDSPAVDAGKDLGAAGSDQRGSPRPVDLSRPNAPGGDGSDIGAFELNLARPTITTQASAGIVAGGTISDTATLANGDAPTGQITFKLYGPNDAACGGTPVFTSTKTVNGNGSYTSDSFTPPTAGTYRWIASYSGDSRNDTVSGACNDANETVVVSKATPTLTTQASATTAVGGTISDTANLSGGVAPTGTITFKAYGPDDTNCGGAAVFTSVVTVTGNGTYNSGNFSPTAPG
ncbi:MAG TPA: choice-of-anchor Q domain-containing protein, partial [Chthoniobacterales bacterium]|nr:choice-of-anchor Q domain-containing protein [Chthoniobacterales bacterium]